MEGSIAFIWELILLRKPKLKHLSASQIKRFSARLQLIWRLNQTSAFLSLINQVNLPERERESGLYTFSTLILSQTGEDGGGKGWEVMAWKDQPLSIGGNKGAMGALAFEQWPFGAMGVIQDKW